MLDKPQFKKKHVHPFPPHLRRLKFYGGQTDELTFKPRKPKDTPRRKLDIPDEEIDTSPTVESEEEDDLESPSTPKITLTKPLKSPSTKLPIQFGQDGLPLATRENLDRMTPEETQKFCPDWTIDRHLNALLVELSDYVKVSLASNKREKCQAIFQYKKDYPSGIKAPKAVSYENAYESFNWRPEPTIQYRGKEWVLPHSPNFKSDIVSRYSEYTLTDKDFNLNKMQPDNPYSAYKYQVLVDKLLEPNTPYRGLLAYHGLGSGKTRTSIMVSTKFIRDRKKILVLLPGALRSNFVVDLYQWGSIEHGIGIKNYRKLSGAERLKAEAVANQAIKHYYDILTYNEKGIYEKLKLLTSSETGMLENRLIIVDEIHNLVSRMSKATNLSRKVYHFLMDNLYNCKLLFLSGTPLLNSAYELSILFNILRGKFRTNHGMYTLFPETEEDFNDRFVNIYDKTMINEKLFKRRISGLVSYYAGTTDKKRMPETIIHPVEKLEMSDHQYQLYKSERLNEGRREKRSAPSRRNSEDQQLGSAFRTYSRMVCNFSFPDGIIRPKPMGARDIQGYRKYLEERKQLDPAKLNIDLDDLMDEIDTSKIEDFKISRTGEPTGDDIGLETGDQTDIFSGQEKTLSKKEREASYLWNLTKALYDLQQMGDAIFKGDNLKKYSPKMWKIGQNIESGPGNEGLIYLYTEFRVLEGVRIMGSVLEYGGYRKIDYSGVNSFDDFKRLHKAGQLRYAIISSDEDSKQRKVLLEIFNHPENAHGEYVKVIMGTSASSEGINLKAVRQIHILEPYWNMVRNDQVIGRGVRLGSHLGLPVDEQNVHVFSYHTSLTSEQQREMVELLDNPKDSRSTDEYIHALALTKQHINSQFLRNIKEGAVDCPLNYLVNVKKNPELMCMDIPADIGKYLYVPDINQDPLDQEYLKNVSYIEYKVGKLEIEGITYGYKVDPMNGRPVLDPPYISYQNQIYHQILTLYDYDLLSNGVEVKRAYYPVGTEVLVKL